MTLAEPHMDQASKPEPKSGVDAPLVVLVTPVYNGAKYLRETMECVQRQTYPNLKHLVLDNASTDGTAEIIASFANPRVPILAHRNQETIPLAANWSAAAALVPSDAKYWAILCGDDLLEPEFTARMVELAERDPAVELVGCMHKRNAEVVEALLPKNREIFEGVEAARPFFHKKGNDLPHMWGLYRWRASDFDEPFFAENMLHFDTNACLRALSRGKFGFVHEPLYIYRIHDESVTETVVRGSTHRRLDGLREIDTWAPRFLPPHEVKEAQDRQLRFIYRAMMWAKWSKHTEVHEGYHAFLKARGKLPSLWDNIVAALEWPLYRVMRRVRVIRRKFFGI
ncbi:MAG: glycosyltransferase family A protein [Hyphomonadaceae bacterium]